MKKLKVKNLRLSKSLNQAKNKKHLKVILKNNRKKRYGMKKNLKKL